jgi:hypothetical protein
MFSHVISYCATSIKKHFKEMDLKVSIFVVVRLCFCHFFPVTMTMSLYLLSMCVRVVCSLILSISFCNHDMIVCIYMNGVPVLFKLFVQGCSKYSSHHVINRQCIYFCGAF